MDIIWEQLQRNGGLTSSQWDEHIHTMNNDVSYYIAIVGNAFSHYQQDSSQLKNFLLQWFERIPTLEAKKQLVDLVISRQPGFEHHAYEAAVHMLVALQWFPQELCHQIATMLQFYDAFTSVMLPIGEEALYFFPLGEEYDWIWKELPKNIVASEYQKMLHPKVWSLINPEPTPDDLLYRTIFAMTGYSKELDCHTPENEEVLWW